MEGSHRMAMGSTLGSFSSCCSNTLARSRSRREGFVRAQGSRLSPSQQEAMLVGTYVTGIQSGSRETNTGAQPATALYPFWDLDPPVQWCSPLGVVFPTQGGISVKTLIDT